MLAKGNAFSLFLLISKLVLVLSSIIFTCLDVDKLLFWCCIRMSIWQPPDVCLASPSVGCQIDIQARISQRRIGM